MGAPDAHKFFTTELFELRVENSSVAYRIHRGLFEAKIGSSATEFRDGHEKEYIFQDTSSSTLLQFVEWAYRDDYSTIAVKKRKDGGIFSISSSNSGDGNELLDHASVYIFADTYYIASLKDLAFDKFVSTVKKRWTISKSALGHTTPVFDAEFVNSIMPVFELCFVDEPSNADQLLDYLGYLAASRIADLLQDTSFLAILPRMVPYLVRQLKMSQFSAQQCDMAPIDSNLMSTTPTKNRPLFEHPLFFTTTWPIYSKAWVQKF